MFSQVLGLMTFARPKSGSAITVVRSGCGLLRPPTDDATDESVGRARACLHLRRAGRAQRPLGHRTGAVCRLVHRPCLTASGWPRAVGQNEGMTGARL